MELDNLTQEAGNLTYGGQCSIFSLRIALFLIVEREDIGIRHANGLCWKTCKIS